MARSTTVSTPSSVSSRSGDERLPRRRRCSRSAISKRYCSTISRRLGARTRAFRRRRATVRSPSRRPPASRISTSSRHSAPLCTRTRRESRPPPRRHSPLPSTISSRRTTPTAHSRSTHTCRRSTTALSMAEKAAYASAWVLERRLVRPESADSAWKDVAERYPNSTFGQAASAFRRGEIDSLRATEPLEQTLVSYPLTPGALPYVPPVADIRVARSRQQQQDQTTARDSAATADSLRSASNRARNLTGAAVVGADSSAQSVPLSLRFDVDRGRDSG